MKIKKIAGILHLWLGLLAGLVVVISMTAAAIFVWDDELTDWYYRKAIFVPVGHQTLPLDSLYGVAQAQLPGKMVGHVSVSRDPARAYVFEAHQSRADSLPGLTHWSDYEYWDKVYVNPYTGAVTGVVDMLYNPIDLTRRLHQNLLLRHEIGHYIVGYSALFVLVLLVTGLILWIPKTKAGWKQRFTIRWRAKWRRTNYDIHNVGGFYTHLFIAIFAITGLVWTFKWWTNGIYRLLGNDPQTVFASSKHPKPQPETGVPMPLQRALTHLQAQRQTWTEVGISIKDDEEGTGEIAAFLRFAAPGWDNSDQYFYHPSTGALIHQVRQEQKTLGAKWRNSNYAIHVGSIWGWPTKVIATLSSLFLASLPITGTLIWWGRKKKKKKKRASNSRYAVAL